MAKTMKKKTAKAGMNGAKSAGKPKKIGAASKVRTKSELFGTIAEQTELSKKQVASVLETMAQIIQSDLNKGPGVVNVAGLMKVTVTRKPATKEREGINPFTKAKQIFKAKPARNVVKVRPLKTLKAMV
jgi:nucleoid DNA-binding protein